MKPNRMILVLVAFAAVAVAIAPTLVKASAGEASAVQQEPAVATSDAPAASVQGPVPTSIPPQLNYCEVSRTCAYPPPSSISCTSLFRDGCSQGSDGYGWVECDGVRSWCSAPSCGGTGSPCIKESDCAAPSVCTCGQGVCSNNACVCPEDPGQ